jgi:hypothetical protein
MLPAINATLTQIAGQGLAADYNDPGTAGTAKWAGSTGIWVADQILQVEGPDKVTEVLQTRLEIPWDVGQTVARGDTLSFTYEGTARNRVARNVIHAPIVGRVRITLEDA